MRFEVSNSTPPHLNRRLQLRMLGFVGLFAVIMFTMTAFQANPKKPKREIPLPGAPDSDIFKVADPDRVDLKPGEFISPPDFNEPDPRTVPDKAPPAKTDDGLDQEIARLETQFDRGILLRVKDNTLGIRHDEADAYFRLVYHASRVNPVELEKAGATDVQFINLMSEPGDYRGKEITIQGELWRLYEFQAGKNDFGLTTLYEAWIFTSDSDRNPYRVVFTNLTRGLVPGENLRQQVRVTGYFFKREGYPSQGGMHVAPSLVANRIVLYHSPNAVPSTDAIVPYMIGLICAVGLAFLVTLVSFAISDRRAARAAQLRELNAPRPSFDGIDAPAMLSVGESLRQLEEQEWKAKTRLNERDDAASALHARDHKTPSHSSESAPPESETAAVQRRRSQADSVKSWTTRQARAGLPTERETSSHSADNDEINVESTDDSERQPPATGNGLSKLAAWENEIQQLSSSESRNERLTAEQRAAQAELRRDQAMREQELQDRLNHDRAELDRNRDQDDE